MHPRAESTVVASSVDVVVVAAAVAIVVATVDVDVLPPPHSQQCF